ncbi:hypothetical protein BGZ80_011130 [Entomortierella chlamydospora]|uniref:WD40 repeat-containing protein n=1 Tax=Entomortierella chlamydospora TaxID=101097 RepID=A0A9P6MTN6_9FUNG|nr:hypothetical protein BGZ80_011130 [Entomortierella chlamydospora]
MFRNIFSPPPSGLPLKDVIDLANRHLEDARSADTSAKVLFLCGNAKTMIKDAENIVNKSVGGRTLNDDIANAYHKHGELLEGLGQHSKAQRSYSKAKRWGYLHVAGRYSGPGSSQPANPNASVLGSLFPPIALSATPVIVPTVLQGVSDLTIATPIIRGHSDDGTPSGAKDQIPIGNTKVAPSTIFVRDAAPRIAKFDLPKVARLLYQFIRHSLESKERLDGFESDWLKAIESDPDEQRRLQSIAVDVIRVFVRDELKTSDIVTEAVSLAAVLEQDEFHKLLGVFVDGIDKSLLLETHFLEGLAYLMKNAPPDDLDSDDLVKILELLSVRLKTTHQQSTQHIYQLSLTVSSVLDSMVDSQVEGIEREQLHEPLSQYLKDLQQSSDPRLVYQAAYAYQALQYIPNDETILQTMLRRTGKVVKGISGVVSAVKAIDLDKFIDGLQHIQEGLKGAGEVISIVGSAYGTVKSLGESGQNLFESLKEGLSFTHKSAWYPALRGLDALLQEGRFVEFERLIRGAVCRRDPAFQLGVCQRLGQLAVSTHWDTNTRQCAISFLGEMYSNVVLWGWHVSVKKLILQILSNLSESIERDVACHAKKILQELKMEKDPKKRSVYQDWKQGKQHPDILLVASLVPRGSLLLDCVQNKPDVKAFLLQVKQERLKEYNPDVYISPRARANKGETETFDLRSRVQEFLSSDKKVFLILGNSGAGKSTFNRALEIDLWQQYNKGDRKIPLFIHMPAIKDLERDLVVERLRQVNFTENQIRELKRSQEFILICDGYDECQQTRNLYTSNRLNQPGEWRAQMVISCRTEYISTGYKDLFQPTDRNSRENWGLFQEAIIAPFNKDQIHDYIDQYVILRESPWKVEDYRRALEQVPNLQDLVTNPFLLKLALDVLPQLLETNSEFSKARITRIKLYDEFIAQWIERSRKRLLDMDLSPRDKEAFKILLDSDFNQLGIVYLKDLATEIYDKHEGNPVVEYSERHDNHTWKKFFFDNNNGKNLLREAIPLVRNNDRYRFMHKSVLEYGLSLAIFDPRTYTENTNPEPRSPRRGSTSSILSFEAPALKEDPVAIIEQSLLDPPFGTKSLVGEPSILEFLGERCQQQPVFKDQLLAIIERSKADKTARIAAANAITVLVRAGVRFIGADLRDVKIPGADLRYGMFDSARLDGADLRKTKLHNIWLRKANLSGADMTGSQFGELPFLQENGAVGKCAYWRDGKTLAVGLRNGGFRLYETSSWEKIKEFGAYDNQIEWFLFSETSDRVAYNSRGWILRLLDVNTGKCFQSLQGHTNGVESVAYSSCGSKVASGSVDKTVRVWNVDTGKCIHILQGHTETVFRVAYSPKADQIASASLDKTIRLWNVETGECIHVLQGHSGKVRSIAYSPNGGQIASASEDGTVRLWDVEIGNCIHNLRDHTGVVNHVAYSPNGDQIASGGEDKTVRLWDVETGNCIHAFQGHSFQIWCVAYSPNGNQIASGGPDETVRLWTVESNHFVRSVQGHIESVRSVAYSPDGGQVVSGSEDKTLRLWDVETGNYVNSLQGHSDWVCGVAYSPKGDQIASGSVDMTVRLWDVETGNCVRILQGHSNAVCSIAYSPNGDRIASGSDDQTVRLWNVKTGGCVRILQGHVGDVNCVAYSPNGNQVASGSHDGTVRLWDVESSNIIHVLQGHEGHVYSVSYSPNGDHIASGGQDKVVRLWSVKTGNCTHTLHGHDGVVESVIYSPNGNHIASGSRDKTARVWNAHTGRPLAVVSSFNGVVFSVAWKVTMNGQYLVTGGTDKSVRHWEIFREHDEYAGRLRWSSSHEGLTVVDASFKDVRGLSKVNQTLMGQRGALVRS